VGEKKLFGWVIGGVGGLWGCVSIGWGLDMGNFTFQGWQRVEIIGNKINDREKNEGRTEEGERNWTERFSIYCLTLL